MSDLIPQRIKTDIGEKTTPLLTFLVKDETGTPVAGTSMDSCTIRIYDEKTETDLSTPTTGRDIIANIDANGVGSVVLTEAETAIVNTQKRSEWHAALVHWEYNAGAGDGKALILFEVKNFATVT
jgi:hypothetical protein